MKALLKKWGLFGLRWGVAIAGIWYVVANISWRDRVNILDANQRPLSVPVVGAITAATVEIRDPVNGQPVAWPRRNLVSRPQAKNEQVTAQLPGGPRTVTLLGMQLTDDLKHVARFLAADPRTGDGLWLSPAQVGRYDLVVPRPPIEVGMGSMLRDARPSFLWLAVFVFPITFLLTSYRWHEMLKALDIRLSIVRTFVLNMVGAFYNTFMPGVTGGDVLKAWYASRQTTHRTRAVMSVFVDRAIGLTALIFLGGVMAAVEYFVLPSTERVAITCGRIALVSAAMLGSLAVGLTVFYHPLLKRYTGLEFLLKRLPMQKQVNNALTTMEMYRRRPGLVFWALVLSLPVHLTTVVSALLAGQAFGLPLTYGYYFVAVPVIILAGSIPISPQGAGVMEFIAIKLTARQGATVSQAFALTMSIRLVQILWNLVGGIFVFRGGYHAPSESEQKELEQDTEEPSRPEAPAPNSPSRIAPEVRG